VKKVQLNLYAKSAILYKTLTNCISRYAKIAVNILCHRLHKKVPLKWHQRMQHLHILYSNLLFDNVHAQCTLLHRGLDRGGGGGWYWGDLLTHRNYSWGKIYAKSVEQETLMRHNEGILPPKFWRVCLLRRGDKFRRRCTLFCKLCEQICCTKQYWKMPTLNEISFGPPPLLPSACIVYTKRRKSEREVGDRGSKLDPNRTTARKFGPL
jgi:hypothetical protein